MAVRYANHWLKTRRQALWQNGALLALLLPFLAMRFNTHRISVALMLTLIALAPFGLAYQASCFLAEQEGMHTEPTPAMDFVFRFVSNVPLGMSGMMLALLSALGR